MKRIKQITVKNLFGMFDHIIPLNLDERITIIHGPNGFGKTAILRLLDSLFCKDNSALQSIPFDEFRVDFEDGAYFQAIKITRLNEQNEGISDAFPPYVTIQFFDGIQEEAINLFSSPYIRDSSADAIWRYNLAMAVRREASDFYREALIVAANNTLMPSERIALDKSSEWLRGIRRSVSVRFIETQRLLNSGKLNERRGEKGTVIVPTVNTYSQELAEIINAKLAESTSLTQSLDRTFPTRLVKPAKQKRKITEDDLRNKLVELERKRQYLTTTGLLDQEGSDALQVQGQDQIDESTKIVLSVYAEDTEKKLGIFDGLANKIDLLKRIINKRFLYKEMTISKEKGFVFTNSKGVMLSPNDLSSGEQHELILFYELLFKVAPGSLILIDEPEISLHVVWQEQFLEDVLAVTRLSDIDVLLATHSPDVIAGRRDLMVELKGPE